MQTIEQMQTRFAALAAEAQSVQDNADKQSRQLTRAESTQLDALLNEMDDLNGRMANARIQATVAAPLPRKTGGPVIGNVATEFRAVAEYVKSGRITNSALSIGGSDAGAATVPTLVSNQIREIQKSFGAIRQLATVMPVAEPIEVPIATTHPGAEWVTESGTRSEQTAPVIKTTTLAGESMSSTIPITNKLLNDSSWPMEQYVTQAIARAFGLTEAAGFISGTGLNGQVKGILAYTFAATADSSRTWGQLEKTTMSTAENLTADAVLALSAKLDPAYRRNASVVLNPATYTNLLVQKSSSAGGYLHDAASSGAFLPPMFGMPVLLDTNMPVVGNGNVVALVGDFRAGYLIQDIGGLQILRDPYKTYGFTTLHVEQRVRAGVVDFNAIKAIVSVNP